MRSLEYKDHSHTTINDAQNEKQYEHEQPIDNDEFPWIIMSLAVIIVIRI